VRIEQHARMGGDDRPCITKAHNNLIETGEDGGGGAFVFPIPADKAFIGTCTTVL